MRRDIADRLFAAGEYHYGKDANGNTVVDDGYGALVFSLNRVQLHFYGKRACSGRKLCRS